LFANFSLPKPLRNCLAGVRSPWKNERYETRQGEAGSFEGTLPRFSFSAINLCFADFRMSAEHPVQRLPSDRKDYNCCNASEISLVLRGYFPFLREFADCKQDSPLLSR
jgi:hypothetical protein